MTGPYRRDYESAAHRELCEAAFDLHDDCGVPHQLTWARAAAKVFKHDVIADEAARAELEYHDICPDCLRDSIAECQCCRCDCTCAAFIWADGRDCTCPLCASCERRAEDEAGAEPEERSVANG